MSLKKIYSIASFSLIFCSTSIFAHGELSKDKLEEVISSLSKGGDSELHKEITKVINSISQNQIENFKDLIQAFAHNTNPEQYLELIKAAGEVPEEVLFNDGLFALLFRPDVAKQASFNQKIGILKNYKNVKNIEVFKDNINAYLGQGLVHRLLTITDKPDLLHQKN